MTHIDNGLILDHGMLGKHDNVVIHADEKKLIEHCTTCGTLTETDKATGTVDVKKPAYLARAAAEDYRR